MSRQSLWGVVVAVALIALILLVGDRGAREEPTLIPQPPVTEAGSLDTGLSTLVTTAPAAPPATRIRSDATSHGDRAPRGARLRGQVVGSHDRQGLPGCEVALATHDDCCAGGFHDHESAATTDATGRFELKVPFGRHVLSVACPGRLPARHGPIHCAATEVQIAPIALETARSVEVFVRTTAGPVSHGTAHVIPTTQREDLADGSDETAPATRTTRPAFDVAIGNDGVLTLAGLGEGSYVMHVTTAGSPRHEQAFRVHDGQCDLPGVITITSGGTIAGRLLGVQVVGGRLFVHAPPLARQELPVGAGGSFVAAGLRAGRVEVRYELVEAGAAVQASFSRAVEVQEGGTTWVDVRPPGDAAWVMGQVRGLSGAATLDLVQDDASTSYRVGLTIENGRCGPFAAPPGPYRYELQWIEDGHQRRHRGEINVLGSFAITVPDAALHVRLLGSTAQVARVALALQRKVTERLTETLQEASDDTRTDARGEFEFRRLGPGNYRVLVERGSRLERVADVHVGAADGRVDVAVACGEDDATGLDTAGSPR